MNRWIGSDNGGSGERKAGHYFPLRAMFPERPHGVRSGRGRYGYCRHTEGLLHGRLRSS